jgi:predicted small lipoprotein YifL
MNRLRRLSAVVLPAMLAVAVVLLIAACGKKGDPVPPPGEPNTYPRVYPSE